MLCSGDVGIELERDSVEDIHISQRKYITNIMKSAGLENTKPSSIPIDIGYFKSDQDDTQLPENSEYLKLVGKLLLVATNSRLDTTAT